MKTYKKRGKIGVVMGSSSCHFNVGIVIFLDFIMMFLA
jgi:hypothetical protein